MPDFIYNIAKGRIAEFYHRVQSNDPANSAIVILGINSVATEGTLKDLETLAAVLADPDTDEVTNTNYTRKVLTEADLVALSADHVNDQMSIDIADVTWLTILAGTAWTHLLLCYDPDITTSTDADRIPLIQYDASAVPDGSDIKAEIHVSGLWKSS